jgi:predicted CXXCH cytochrome family protein
MKLTLLTMLLFVVTTAASAFEGPRQIIFPTANGNVSFMHGDHQDSEKDCAICHPGGKTGKIPGFSKEAAHKFCIDCHKQKSGPTKCAECHEK